MVIDDKVINELIKGCQTEEDFTDLFRALKKRGLEAVLDDVKAWQSRLLDSLYPIVYLDCLVVKVREDKSVMNKAVFLALGINADGHKELLGMWICRNEGAKFWLHVLTALKNRGLETIFIFCVDGLSGFPDSKKWTLPIHHWKPAMNRFIIEFDYNSDT